MPQYLCLRSPKRRTNNIIITQTTTVEECTVDVACHICVNSEAQIIGMEQAQIDCAALPCDGTILLESGTSLRPQRLAIPQYPRLIWNSDIDQLDLVPMIYPMSRQCNSSMEVLIHLHDVRCSVVMVFSTCIITQNQLCPIIQVVC